MSVEVADNLAFYLRLLHPVITTCGLPVEDIKVVDICSGQGELIFLLMEYFNLVGSNDACPNATTSNKYALTDNNLWSMVEEKYNTIITRAKDEQEVNLIASKFIRPTSPIFVALLVPAATHSRLKCKSIEVEILGFKLKWQLLFPNPAFKPKLDINTVILHPEILATSSCFDLFIKYKMELEHILSAERHEDFP